MTEPTWTHLTSQEAGAFVADETWRPARSTLGRGALLWRHLLLAAAVALSLPATHAQEGNNDTSLPSIPDHFQQRGLSANQGYENQAVNEAIDTFTGRLQYHFTDIFIPGPGGMDLAIRRSYTSIDDPNETPSTWSSHEYSPVGLGWTMHMGRVIRGSSLSICASSWTMASRNPVLELPDGRRQVLYEREPGTMWITKDFWRATCQGGDLHVQSPDGTTYQMTALGHSFGQSGSLQRAYYAGRIVDRNGNWFNLSYQTLPNGTAALDRITTSDGRSVSFAYSGSTLSAVTDDNTARVWNYTVSSGPGGQVYLSEVRRPDGLSWRFAYRASSPGLGSMSRVEYPSGGSIDYVYDHVNFRAGYVNNWPSTVIRQKTSSTNTPDGATGTWNWAYEVATEVLPNTTDNTGWTWYEYNVPPPVRSQVNVTQITDPLGQVVEHYHMGLQSVNASNKLTGTYLGYVAPNDRALIGYQDIAISTQQEVDYLRFGVPGETGGVVARVKRGHWQGRLSSSHNSEWSNFDLWGNAGLLVETGEGALTFVRRTTSTYTPDTTRWLLRLSTQQEVTVQVEGQPDETYRLSRVYDSSGNVTSVTDAGVTTSHTYTPQGDLASTTDARGNTTSFSSHFRGIARQENQPEGVNLSRTVDSAGNVTAQTSGRGHTTTFAYDALNRTTRITPAVGATVSIDYAPRSRTVTRGDMVDVTTLDGLGRPLGRRVSAAGQSDIAVNYRHDILGRRVFASYPNASADNMRGIGTEYDHLGRPVRVLHNATADLSSSDAVETYVDYGLSLWHTDAQGNGSLVRFRAFGDPGQREVIESMQGRIEGELIYPNVRAAMRRNAKGQLTSVTMGDVTRSFEYDSRYFLQATTEPETGRTEFGRDAVGNLTSRRLSDQSVINYTYDARNRLTHIVYPTSENSQVPQAASVVNTYDNNDQLVSAVAGSVQRNYTYDANNKLTAESLVVDGRTFAFAYGYDNNEALASVTYPSGRQVSYQPDAFGRARAAQPYVTAVSYHANGLPDTMTYANGLATSMELHPRQWPSRLRLSRASGDLIDSNLAYDAAGHITAINDTADGSFSRAYEYDGAYRLTSETIAGQTNWYTYDNKGDIRYSGPPISGLPEGTPFPFTHNYDGATGRLATVGTAAGVNRAYAYDAAGNVTSDGVNQFGFDRANQMRCVQCGSASQTLYTYDGQGLRVKTQSSDGQVSYAVYGHNGLLMLTEIPGVERREKVYLGRRQVAEHRVRLD